MADYKCIMANARHSHQGHRSCYATAAGWSAAVFLLALPWLSGGGYAYAGSLRATMAEAAAILFLLVFAFHLWQASSENTAALLRHPGVWLIVAFAAWAALSRLWTTDALATTHSLRLPVSFVLVFVFLLAAGKDDIWRKRLLWAATASGVVLAIGACHFRTAGLHATGRFQYPYDHPASLAGALLWPTVALALNVIFFLLRHRWLAAIASGAAIIPCVRALWGSGTRSSLLGAGIGIVVGVFLFAHSVRDLPAGLAKFLRRLVSASVLVSALAAGVYAGMLLVDRAQRESIYTGTFGTRVLFAATACRMALSRPLLGHGLGTFPSRSAYHEKSADFLHGQRGDVVYSAHSEPAQVLAELGLIGLILWLTWHFWHLRQIMRQKRQASAASIDPAFIIAVAGFYGMFADSCGSMALRYLELPWHYAGAAALAWAWIAPRSTAISAPVPPLPRRLVGIALAAAALIYAYAIIWPAAQAQRTFQTCLMLWQSELQKGRTANITRQIIADLQEVRATASDLYLWYFATQRLSRYAEHSGEYAAALAARFECLEHFAGDAVNRKELVRLLYRLGRHEDALAICLQGMLLNPHDRYADAWLGKLLRGVEMAQLRAWLTGGAYLRPSAYSLDLTESECLYLEIRLLWEAGGRERAAAEIEHFIAQGIDRDIRLGIPRLHAADWHYALGNREKALALLQPLLTCLPPDPRVLALAADILATSSDPLALPVAYAYIERAVLLGRSIPQVVEVATALYIASRDPRLRTEAERIARGAVSYNPHDPDLRRILIITLWRLGNQSAAESALLAAQRSFLGSSEQEMWEELQRRICGEQKNSVSGNNQER